MAITASLPFTNLYLPSPVFGYTVVLLAWFSKEAA